jgi:hypothetical protein
VPTPLFLGTLQGEAGRGRSREAFLESLPGPTSNLSAVRGVLKGSFVSAFRAISWNCSPSNWALRDDTGLIDSPSVLWSPFPLMVPEVQAHMKGATGRSGIDASLPRHMKKCSFLFSQCTAVVLLGHSRLTGMFAAHALMDYRTKGRSWERFWW